MKKLISLVLAMTIVMSVFMGLSFSVSAEETADVLNVTVNGVTTQVPVGEKFTYHYTLSDLKIINTEASLNYDSSKLKVTVVDDSDEDIYNAFLKQTFPKVYAASIFYNADLTDKLLYNFSLVKGFTFAENEPLTVFEFTVLEAGDATISTDIIEMVNADKEFIVDKTPSGSVKLMDYTYNEYITYVAPEKPTEEPTVEPTIEPTETTPDEPTVEPTVEPTEEPTVEPTEEPTVEPTEEPTVEPTVAPTEPPVTDITLKFAAPASNANNYNWNLKDVVFFYGNNSAFDANTLVEMTATADKYYTEETGSNTIITGGNGWTIYEVTFTAEQAAEVEAAKFVGFATPDGLSRTTFKSTGNVLKAGIDTFGAYGEAATLADLNGKTFIIRDSEWGEKNAQSYVGYWLTSYNTIKFAAPTAYTTYYNWHDVEFFYTDVTVYDQATKLGMVNTLETTKVKEPGVSTLRSGNWYVYAVSVDATVAAEIEAATYTGFAKPGASNRTHLIKNVFKAKVDEFDGAYLDTAKTVAEVEGMIFVPQGPALATSRLTYDGEWQTEEKYTQGNDESITIKFAAPINSKAAYDWSEGVDLYYGDTTNYKELERIAMTKTGKTVSVSVDGTTLETVESGAWEVYEVELTLEQIKAIDRAGAIGFIKAGSWNRTSTNFYRSILSASKMEGITTYGNKESVETFDGLTFVINGELNSAYESTTYLGSWIQ